MTTGHLLLADRYEILSLLGAGGMGTVYRARDRELDEVVALKMLRKELASDPEMLARFRLEAKLARRVTHPNVARTFDIGEHDGDKFLTMELIDGESLAAKIARDGILPLLAVIHIAEAICAGLSAAHAAGVVHRDLKPDNVILGKNGEVKITDFGIARALASAGGAQKTLGMALGTPAYMAPEQVEAANTIDARADVYALGAMLFELVTGEQPWRGESVYAVAAARLVHPPPDPRTRRADVPDAVARVVQRCMAKSPNDRYPTAADVAHALSALTLPSDPMIAVAAPVRVNQPADKTQAGMKTIAVLPFRNLGAPAEQYFVEGFTDDLIDTLSMTPGLRTRPRGAVIHLKGVERDPRDLGRELGVHVVVEGSLAKIADKIQIRVRLLSVEDGFQLWAKRFDRAVGDLFEVGSEAAVAIASALAVKPVTTEAAAQLDPRALDLYLRARHQYRSDAGSAKDTLNLFEQALAIAPDNPMILSGYALALGRVVSFGQCDAAEANRAREIAERAVAVGPHLPEARMALARLRNSAGDYAGAALDVRAAATLAPSHADAHAFWGRFLIEAGDLDGGIHRCRIALGLDEGLILTRADLARAYAFRGQWSEVDAIFSSVPFGNSSSASMFTARMALWRQDKALAESVLRNVDAIPSPVRSAVVAMHAVVANGALNTEERAGFDRMMTLGPAAHSFGLQLRCEVNAALRDYSAALGDIEKADERRLCDLSWLDLCPLFAPCRQEPRFVAARAGFASRASQVIRVLQATT